MSLLTGPEIERRVASGELVISPFDSKATGPNSHNLTLNDRILIYKKQQPIQDFWEQHYDLDRHMRGQRGLGIETVKFDRYPWTQPLDLRKKEETIEHTLPSEGFTLYPGVLYLASTVEYTESPGVCPKIDGRSSTGRLGLFSHITAGCGDDGFRGNFTLELAVIGPLTIYPSDPICQISYQTLEGERRPYAGRYQDSTGVVASRFHKD